MTRKFQILIVVSLVAIVVLTSAIGLVWSDIQKKKADLDRFYWLEEHMHSSGAGYAIEIVEAELRKRQTVLTSLIVATTLLVIVDLIVSVWSGKEVRK